MKKTNNIPKSISNKDIIPCFIKLKNKTIKGYYIQHLDLFFDDNNNVVFDVEEFEEF